MPPWSKPAFHLLIYLWAGSTIVLIGFLYNNGWRAMAWWQRGYVWILGLFAAVNAIFIAVVYVFPDAPNTGTIGHLITMLGLGWEMTIVLLPGLLIWGAAVGITQAIVMYRQRRAEERAAKG